jgi:hypothetical protein
MTTTTEDLAPGTDGELEITELVEFDPTRLDGVKSGATGIGFLVMKSAAAPAEPPAAEPAVEAETDARALALAAIAKAVTDGQVDEAPDVSLGQQIMRLLAQAIQAEAAEIEAGAYDEVMDVRLLCRAADMVASWTGREQGGCGCCSICTGTGCGCCGWCQGGTDGVVMDSVAREPGAGSPPGEDDTKASSSKSTLAPEEAAVHTDPDGGQIATAVDAAVAKALKPLEERNQALGAELAKAQADIAKFAAMPRPGGPVMSVTRPLTAPGAEDHAAKAAHYERMADTVSSPADADGYRQLAAQARAKISAPAQT